MKLRLVFKVIIAIFLVFIAITIDVATRAPLPSAQPTLSPWEYDIDPTFRSFYIHYGGRDVFGQAISGGRLEGALLVQYTETAKMIYDPSAPTSGHFSLAPLGKKLTSPEPDVPPPQDSSLIYINGHIIDPVFAETYAALADILGKPLTEAHQNARFQRIEQFFENMGVAYDLASGEIGYLAYGAALCDSNCRVEKPTTLYAVFRLPESALPSVDQ